MCCFQSKRVGILDADVYGPSIPRMLNLQGPVHVDDREFSACAFIVNALKNKSCFRNLYVILFL